MKYSTLILVLIIKSVASEKLLVIGGEKNGTTSVEVINLSNDDDDDDDESVDPFPIALNRGFEVTIPGGNVTICGGFECQELLNDDGSWHKLPFGPRESMKDPGVVFVPDIMARWIIGSKSSEIFNGTSFEEGPELPPNNKNFSSICAAQVSVSETVVITPESNWIYDWDIKKWERIAPMPEDQTRNSTTCGFVQNPKGEGRVFVVGGRVGNKRNLDSVQVYDPVKESWSNGPQLPREMAGARLVQSKEDGTWYLTYQREIYKLEGNDSWIKLDQELSSPRSFHVSVLLQDYDYYNY